MSVGIGHLHGGLHLLKVNFSPDFLQQTHIVGPFGQYLGYGGKALVSVFAGQWWKDAPKGRRKNKA